MELVYMALTASQFREVVARYEALNDDDGIEFELRVDVHIESTGTKYDVWIG